MAAAVTDYDSAVANLLLDGQGAASADPSELPRTYLARAALNEKLGRYVLTSHHSPFTTHHSHPDGTTLSELYGVTGS